MPDTDADPARIEPMDEHNQALVQNVHPPGWRNPTPDGRYNMVVVGAGTAGLVTAIATAGLGGKVALIEKHLMGGDCLNVGCVPSKTLLHAARHAHRLRQGAEIGVTAGGEVQVDFAAVMRRLRSVRSQISVNDSARRFTELGVDVYLGEGRFTEIGRARV